MNSTLSTPRRKPRRRPTKRQFVSYWLDLDPRKYFATTRKHVAYLLRAARSRGDQIHRLQHVGGYNYRIGELCLNVRHAYHDKVLTQ
jgi:hypothetical protein